MFSVVVILCALQCGASDPSAAEAAKLVAEGRGEAQRGLQVLLRQGKYGLRALLEVARGSEGEERRRAYAAIGAFRGDEALTALLEGLSIPDRYAQMGAVQGLARMGTVDAIEPLIKTALTPDPMVRAEIADGLVKIGRPAEPFVKKLLDSPSPYARETALRYFARFYTGRQRRRVIVNGLRDEAANVREAAVDAAELWRDASLADALVELSRDPDPEVASRAVEAVAKFPTLRQELPKVLADPQVTRQAWMTAFHRMRDYDDMAIPYLIAALAKAEPKRQAIMLDLLSADASDKELRAFVDLLDSPEADITDIVQDVLQKMGARADTAAARMVLTERGSLAEAIRTYLANRPRGGITDEILDQAKDGEVDERAEAIQIIGELEASEVREDLVDLLDDTETQIRVEAARALAGLNDVGAEAELVRLLDDDRKEVRIEAVRALKAYPSRLSVLARISAVEDPEESVRRAAMESFRGTNEDSVLDTLERIVRTGTPGERFTAMSAIAEIRTPRAAVLLVNLCTEEDRMVREAATAYFASLPELKEPFLERAGEADE